ncbi:MULTISPECIES: helix-turn-helix domain-containing protein [Rhodococcus]|uniref:Helix-turn-helix transcriptional regulator n=1 Tax=Rhodococcus cercidiphylli TaxID=489916 RepID=A0ABU4B0B6_9NOCA|nr:MULTISPECIES: helix-turn-helix transcriptional regulator [Rhodococcus]MDV6231924.1 helix-turn-helix transcriptional regulator [Rhodococcus cercidiphylli]
MGALEDTDKAIGQAVQRARIARGWSQTALAERLAEASETNWLQQTVLRLESGQRSLKVRELILLSEVLGISPAGLLDGIVREQHSDPLDVESMNWMIRDLNNAITALQEALIGQERSATQVKESAQQIRHQRDVLEAEMKSRQSRNG